VRRARSSPNARLFQTSHSTSLGFGKARDSDTRTTYLTPPSPPPRSPPCAALNKVNPGFLDSVKVVFAAGTTACHDLAFSLPARQLASSLLAVNPTFLQDDYQGQDYSGLRKLQSVLLAPQKVVRTAVVEALLRPNSVHNTIYQSRKSPEARAWLDADPKTEALTMSPSEFRTAFRNRLLIPHPQLLARTTCACGQDVDVLGVHTQKCRLDGNLTNSTHNRLVAEMIRSCGQ
jgi:hypothetical protein